MKNSKTPKIVVAVALAAVYASGLAAVTLRKDKSPVQTAVVAPAPQIVAEPVAPAAIVPESTAPASVIEQAPPVSVKSPGAMQQSSSPVTIAPAATVSPAARSESVKPQAAGEVASVGSETDIPAQAPPAPESVEAATSDGDSEIDATDEGEVN